MNLGVGEAYVDHRGQSQATPARGALRGPRQLRHDQSTEMTHNTSTLKKSV